MNILIITQFAIPHFGGASTHIEDLISSLEADGHKTNLIEGRLVQSSLFQRLMYVFLSGGKNGTYRNYILKNKVRQIVREIKVFLTKNHIDVIHCHDPVAGYATHIVLAELDRDIPVVQTIHGPLTYETKMMMGVEIEQSGHLKQLWKIEKQSFLKAKHLIAVDTGQAKIAINAFGIGGSKVTVIFNAVSCETIDSITKKQTSIKHPETFLLVPRRLVKKTGVHIAIKALAQLESGLNVDLLIAGNGNLRGELRKLSEKLGISSHVKFLGSISRKEVLRLAKDALAVVVPSIPSDGVVEATSLAALEAMACGTVVVASDIGGLAELIQHNETGFLVPPNDPQSLSEVIRMLIRKPEIREKICRQERQYVLQNLDTPIWLSKILKVYGEFLKK